MMRSKATRTTKTKKAKSLAWFVTVITKQTDVCVR